MPTSCTSRREFLAASLATAGAAAFPSFAFGQAPASGLIDVHHHVLPDFWKKATASATPWTLEGSLQAMDKNGVATSMCSITAPGSWITNDRAQSRTLSRQCNEYMAKLAQDHKGRFGTFAALPLPDVDGSLAEIAYALDTLKTEGVALLTNFDDKWLGDASYTPVLTELNRRKAVVYVHPGGASCCGNLVPLARPQIAEYPHDTTRAVLSLLTTGALTKFRDIRFIFSHGGGTVPYLAGRIVQMTRQQKDLPQIAPQGVETELKRLYYEVANSTSAPSMAALLKFAPLSQILFGTDYPFVPIEATADPLKAYGLSAAESSAIGRDNALKLLKG